MLEKTRHFIKETYHKLICLDDSPHRIAAGFAIGVFLGILPAAGPMAAVVVAWVFRANRVAAFVGGFFTNTWLSVLTFVVAIKIGAFVTGTHFHRVYNDCKELMKHFNWHELLDESILQILKPVFAGYALVGAVAGVAAYGIAYWLTHRKHKAKPSA
jgi:uncharacterized protein (DUF2062 family)